MGENLGSRKQGGHTNLREGTIVLQTQQIRLMSWHLQPYVCVIINLCVRHRIAQTCVSVMGFAYNYCCGVKADLSHITKSNDLTVIYKPTDESGEPTQVRGNSIWSLKRDPSERLTREGPSNCPKWSSNPRTFWSLSRRLLGVEQAATTFFYPFHAIFERGIISEHILNNINRIALLRF